MINIVIHDELLPLGLRGEDILEAIEIRQVSGEAQRIMEALEEEAGERFPF